MTAAGTTMTRPNQRDRPVRPARTFAPHELGRNGNPPPYAYQRRIDYLGPEPKRGGQFRSDFIDSVNEAQRAGTISARSASVASIVAAASNRYGKDITFTERWFAKQLHKVNGSPYSARYISDGLDELRTAGFIDWEHGQESQRFDDARRQMLGGRWQGACTYRLLIPQRFVDQIEQRRQQYRERRTGGGRTTPAGTQPETPPRRHRRPADGRRAAVIDDARRLARNVTSFDRGVKQLDDAYKGSEYMLAYEEFRDAWNSRGSP